MRSLSQLLLAVVVLMVVIEVAVATLIAVVIVTLVGAQAIVLACVLSHLKQETAGPEEYGIPANTLDPSISWKDVYWLQSLTRLPIIIKGILTKEDAELAVEHGVQGIIVSNHGGRQLDGGPATVQDA